MADKVMGVAASAAKPALALRAKPASGLDASRFDPSRGLLPKPSFGAACNSCGRCCVAVQCVVSVALFGERDLCPALEDGGDQRLTCGVMRDAPFYASTPKWSDDVLSEAMRLLIGAGIGCDSEDDDEPANAVAVGRRAIYGRAARALDLASNDARALVALLRDSDGSGEADKTGTGLAEGDSAGPQGHRPNPSTSIPIPNNQEQEPE